MSKINLLVCSYAISPELSSSEAFVNKNWIDILNKDCEINLVSVFSSVKYNEHGEITTYKSKYLKFIYKFAKKNTVFYKISNKFFLLFNTNYLSFYQYLWSSYQYNNIVKYTNCTNSNTLIYVRILPSFQLMPIIKYLKKYDVPLLINVNDPLENDQYSKSNIVKLNEYKITWTFPSERLLNNFAKLYSINTDNCFVIPHAMKKQDKLYFKKNNSKLKFLYTGTLYKSAFSVNLLSQLKKISESEFGEKIEFHFVFIQYTNETIIELKKYLPKAIIDYKLNREKVLELINEADCLLVLDAPSHVDLLKGKLAEGISFGMPIFSISYPDSVMDKVVKEYGGFSSYENINHDVFEKLKDSYLKISDINWNEEFYKKREKTMNYFSSENIQNNTKKVLEYAINLNSNNSAKK